MSSNKCLQKSDDLYQKRIKALQEKLQEVSFDAWVVEDPLDLYYLTGESLSAGELWITENKAKLFVDGRYIEKVEKNKKLLSSLTSKDAILEFLSDSHIQKIGFDAKKTSFARVEDRKKTIPLHWEPVSSITETLRKEKSAEELCLLRKSAEALWQGYLHIKTLLQEGITEKEVAKRFEIFCLEQGVDALSFEPIIAFGENSALPHHKPSQKKLRKRDIVLIDIGVMLNRYASDMTRVAFFGEPDPFLEHWLDLAIRAQQKAISLCAPGVAISELDLAARSVFKEEQVEQYFVHSLGHGIGLNVHEGPRIHFENKDEVLKAGMVITIEPGLYLPGKGGVRYEDMIIITEKGCENVFPFDKAFL